MAVACCYCLLAFLLPIRPAASIFFPLQYIIPARKSQCIYTRFEHGEFATFEVFIVGAADDGRPEAAVQIEGPVGSPKVGEIDEETGERTWGNVKKDDGGGAGQPTSLGKMKQRTNTMGAAMQNSIEKWPQYVSDSHKHFNEQGIIHHAFHIDYTHSGGHEDAISARADISRQRNVEMERRRARSESVEGEIYEEEETSIDQIIPDRIKPYEWTKPIKAPGWYRMCLTVEKAITAEMDIRSSAELGGVDPETWHVFTYDEREAIDEEEKIMGLKEERAAEEAVARALAEELDKALKGQVKDYDLDSTRTLMKEVNRLVTEMQKKQREVHKRIKGHEGDARRNRKRISRSGAIETALYLAITLFQMYTVRNWLLGSNVLGRA